MPGRAALQQRELREPARLRRVESARARLVGDVLPREPRLDPTAAGAGRDGPHRQAVDGCRAARRLVTRALPLPAAPRHAPPQLELQRERAPRRGIRRCSRPAPRHAPEPRPGVNDANARRQSPAAPPRARAGGSVGGHAPMLARACDTRPARRPSPSLSSDRIAEACLSAESVYLSTCLQINKSICRQVNKSTCRQIDRSCGERLLPGDHRAGTRGPQLTGRSGAR